MRTCFAIVAYLLSILFLGICSSAFGQITIRGKVIAENGSAVEGCYLSLTKKGSKAILAYAISGSNGSYRLSYSGTGDSVCVSATRLDYARQTVCIPYRTQEVNFTMREEVSRLKEVVVRPTKAWRQRDTINFSVSGFVNRSDRNIADVLKKLPGIEVEPTGQISYNGEPINRFYVNNMDLMGGRYSQISNNLSHAHVATVQILENHEPIKVLQDHVYGDKAAVNLVLKESSTARWLIAGKLGAGASPALWDNELTAMRFSTGSQGSYTYKNNNTGNDIAADITAHYGMFRGEQKSSLLAIPFRIPNLNQQQRFMFNNAHLATANQLYKLTPDYELRFTLDFVNDAQVFDSESTTTFFTNDGETAVSEKIHAVVNTHKARAGVTLTGNSSKYYLTNRLTGQADWSNTLGVINSSYQRLESPYYNLVNSFTLLKAYERLRLTVTSNTRLVRMPQSLMLRPAPYQAIFEGTELDALLQDALQRNVSSDNSLAISLIKGKWKREYSLGAAIYSQSLNTSLGLEDRSTKDEFLNDLQSNNLKLYSKAIYSYAGPKLSSSLSIPFGYILLNANDPTHNLSIDRGRLFIHPALNLSYKLNQDWSLNSSAGYSDGYSDIQSIYAGYILENYRSIARNDSDFMRTDQQSYSVGISYNNPIRLANARLSVYYQKYKLSQLFQQEFDGILSIRKGMEYPNSIDSKSVYLSVSKGFEQLVSKLSVKGFYSVQASNQLQSGELAVFQQQQYSGSAEVRFDIASWLNSSYTFSCVASNSSLESKTANITNSTIYRITHSGRLNILPTKTFQLSAVIDYERIKSDVIFPSILFFDMQASYKIKKFELVTSWTNILNKKSYIQKYYSDFYSAMSTFRLRPTNILLTIRYSL